MNAADRQQIDSCFRLARLDGLADDSRTAALFRAVLALLVAGLRVETYWDCRTKVRAMRACVLPIGDRIMVP